MPIVLIITSLASAADEAPFERVADRVWLEHLPPESWGAPAWSLFGGNQGPVGSATPNVMIDGVLVASPGDPVPLLPTGTVERLTTRVGATGGMGFTPGGRVMDVTPRIADGALQLGGPTPRGVARATFFEGDDGGGLSGAIDVEDERQIALVHGSSATPTGRVDLTASGASIGRDLDVWAGGVWHDDTFDTNVRMVGRQSAWVDGSRLYRVGLGFDLERRNGLTGGFEVDHRAVDSVTARRAGAWVDEQLQAGPLVLNGSLRIDAQDRTGAAPDSRYDLGPRVSARLGTTTWLAASGARYPGVLVVDGDDLPNTEVYALEVGQELPLDAQATAGAAVTRYGRGEAYTLDAEVSRDVEGWGVVARASAGDWIDVPKGASDTPWAEAVALVALDPTPQTRLGLAGRWRSFGEDAAPLGAAGWLADDVAPHVDVGGRAVQGIGLGDGALEVEVSAWTRSIELPALPREAGRSQLDPDEARVEGAIRYTW